MSLLHCPGCGCDTLVPLNYAWAYECQECLSRWLVKESANTPNPAQGYLAKPPYPSDSTMSQKIREHREFEIGGEA